jgi:hypothetical protein
VDPSIVESGTFETHWGGGCLLCSLRLSGARQRVLCRTTADTLFACFLCGNYSHWFLVLADLGSCSMNIFNSAGALGNQLAIKHLLPLLMYMGSFEDSIFGSSWGWEVRHADQQQNGYDSGPLTIANCLRIVYSWATPRYTPTTHVGFPTTGDHSGYLPSPGCLLAGVVLTSLRRTDDRGHSSRQGCLTLTFGCPRGMTSSGSASPER